MTPLDRVGIYVPGGKAAYPSSVLMNVIPAQVAGVAEIVMVVPTPGGARNPLVLAAAHLVGVTRAFAIGGAQAIAALAYGTATIPPVDKICGPGNAYVAAAKRRVFGAVGIDMIAGVSEILVIADASANADWVAMDLFAQAEHDELAQAILVTPDAALLEAVAASAQRQIAGMPRRAIIAASLAHRGALIKVRDLDEACAIANRVAPEHLELAVADPAALLPKIRHAGAIFMGHHASEALGDYCAGPNHVLPTGRTARFSSPLGVYDFQKRSSVLGISSASGRARSAPSPRRSRTARDWRRTRRAPSTACPRDDRAHARRLRRGHRPSRDPRAVRLRGRARRRPDQARRDGEPVPAAAGGPRRRSRPPSQRCRSIAIRTAARMPSSRRCAGRSASRRRWGSSSATAPTN